MTKSKIKALPPSRSLDELVEFFDTHDMGEYWDHMPEVDFDIDIKRRMRLVALDEKLIEELAKIAKARRVSPERLIHYLAIRKDA
jgi:hypothetical protein